MNILHYYFLLEEDEELVEFKLLLIEEEGEDEAILFSGIFIPFASVCSSSVLLNKTFFKESKIINMIITKISARTVFILVFIK